MQDGTLFLVFEFPAAWPPPDVVHLASSGGATLMALRSGAIRLLVVSADGGTIADAVTQPIDAQGRPRVVLSVRWAGPDARFDINGQSLALGEERPALTLKRDDSPESAAVVIPTPPTGCPAEVGHFLNTCTDVQQRAARGSVYEVIRASGLLRHLFIDASPLVHLVNRHLRLKLAFAVVRRVEEPEVLAQAELRWESLDPAVAPGAEAEELNLDSFLGRPCLWTRGRAHTVADVIRFCAHVKGGVHSGSATSEQQHLVDIDDVVRIAGEAPTIAALRGISLVALRGMDPLFRAMPAVWDEGAPDPPKR